MMAMITARGLKLFLLAVFAIYILTFVFLIPKMIRAIKIPVDLPDQILWCSVFVLIVGYFIITNGCALLGLYTDSIKLLTVYAALNCVSIAFLQFQVHKPLEFKTNYNAINLATMILVGLQVWLQRPKRPAFVKRLKKRTENSTKLPSKQQ